MTRRDIRRKFVPDEVIPTGWRFAALCLLYPERAAWAVRFAFRRWAVLPGDRFEDFQCDETYEVLSVKADHVIALAIPGYGDAHEIKASRRAVPTLQWGERSMVRWVPRV